MTDAQPLRVLHVTYSLGLGGAETLLNGLVTRESIVEHQVVCLGARDWYSSKLEDRGITLTHLEMRSVHSIIAGIARLRQLIRRSGADVIQAWMPLANLISSTAAARTDVPVVWSLHSSSLDPIGRNSRLSARLGGSIAGWAPDFVVSCSIATSQFYALLGYGAAEGAVVHNGYDPTEFFPNETSRVAARQSLGVGDDVFLIGGLSRWIPAKDVPNWLHAVHIARGRGLPVEGILLGHDLDPDNSGLENAIAQTGCTGIVRPLGRRSDVQQLARAMDLHLLSSLSEACPNVVAETMLSGTPNVATDVGDSALMVGDTGWIVPTGQPQRTADAIEQAHCEWKNRPDEWNWRRSAARNRIAEHFNFDRMVENYKAVWRRVAKRG